LILKLDNMYKTKLYYKLAISSIIEKIDTMSKEEILESLNKIVENDEKRSYS